MEKMFIVKILYYLDLNKIVSSFKKNRKVCFADPLFFYLFSDVCLSKVPDESVIVENVVISHLSRRFEVLYWKNKREIDVIAKDKKLIGFEIKRKEKIGKLEDVICLTKNILNKEKNLIPVSLFLA
jgi:predicted AAA+ superfamily ATPase